MHLTFGAHCWHRPQGQTLWRLTQFLKVVLDIPKQVHVQLPLADQVHAHQLVVLLCEIRSLLEQDVAVRLREHALKADLLCGRWRDLLVVLRLGLQPPSLDPHEKPILVVQDNEIVFGRVAPVVEILCLETHCVIAVVCLR